MKRLCAVLAILAAPAGPVAAYPPAPAFTLHGTVRDAFGWALEAADAEIIVRDAVSPAILARGPITLGAALSENYRLLLPLDHARAGAPYRSEARVALVPFRIEVVVDGLTFFPVQTNTPVVSVLRTAEFAEANLALSEDGDGDGLPDLWEQWQLEAAGWNPTDILLLSPGDDLDGDGMSNYDEYIAGTFALIGSDNLLLEFIGSAPDGWTEMEFLQVIGKTYTLERSRDLVAWQRAPVVFSSARTNPVLDWTATDTRVQRLFTTPDGVGRWFYRLIVR